MASRTVAFAALVASATAAPEQIHLALAGQDVQGYADAMSVAWFTPSPSETVVQWGTQPDVLTESARGASTNYLVAEGVDYGHHHKVKMTNLRSDTVYYYRVGNGVDEWSEVKSFTSANRDPTAPFRMSVVGDMGYLGTPERPLVVPPVFGLSANWTASYTREAMVENKDGVDLTLIVGDIAYADNSFTTDLDFTYDSIWNGYMDWMEPIASTQPFMTAVGNHENECHGPTCLLDAANYGLPLANFTAYNHRFDMPSESSGGRAAMWYSYNVGPVHFVSINSETDWPGAPLGERGAALVFPSGSFGEDGEYLEWLENDLAQAAADRDSGLRPWIVAVGHRPIGSVRTYHEPLFDKYGVDVYLAGHMHSYLRSVPVRDGQVREEAVENHNHYNKADGTTYIVTGGAGCDEMDYNVDPVTGEVTMLPQPDITRAEAVQRMAEEGAVPKGSVAEAFDVRNSFYSHGVLESLNTTALKWTLFSSGTGKVLDELLLTK